MKQTLTKTMTVLPRLPFLSRQRRQDWKEVKEEDSSKNKFKYRKQERDNLNDAERLQEYEQIFRRIDDYKRLEKGKSSLVSKMNYVLSTRRIAEKSH